MRTLIIICIGFGIFVLMLLSSYVARRKSSNSFDAPKLFIILWFLFVVVDTIVGVSAGYSFLDELMIHSLIFALPALAAWFFMGHGN